VRTRGKKSAGREKNPGENWAPKRQRGDGKELTKVGKRKKDPKMTQKPRPIGKNIVIKKRGPPQG